MEPDDDQGICEQDSGKMLFAGEMSLWKKRFRRLQAAQGKPLSMATVFLIIDKVQYEGRRSALHNVRRKGRKGT